MYGLFQTSIYFANTAIICFGLFTVLGMYQTKILAPKITFGVFLIIVFIFISGSVGYFAANKFVKSIYKNVKLD